jgi:hypothetical protein
LTSLKDTILRRAQQLHLSQRRPKDAWGKSGDISAALVELADVIAEWDQEIQAELENSMKSSTCPDQ